MVFPFNLLLEEIVDWAEHFGPLAPDELASPELT